VRVTRLGDVTKIRTGKLYANASSEDGEYPFFTCAKQSLRISSYTYDCECVLVAGNGDLNVKYYEGKFDAYQRTYIVEVLPAAIEDLHLRYVYHFLETYLETLREQSIGGIIKYIKLGNLTEAPIPLSPLPEQRRIAAILDAADALRAKRRETLAQLDTLLQSTFLDMFGDPVTNPMRWEKREVEDVCRLVRGSSPRPKGDPKFFGGPVPRLMVADITRDGFWVTPRIDSLTKQGAKKSRPVPEGTVVMAVSGEVGVIAMVQVPCCVHDGFVAFLDLDVETFDSRFFMFQFHFLKITHERRKAGAIFQNLTTKDIKAMWLPTPPLDRQARFATIVESIEQQKTSQRAHLAELDTLFASLQSRAFLGDL